MINGIVITTSCAITGGIAYSFIRKLYHTDNRDDVYFLNIGTLMGGLLGSYYMYCGRSTVTKVITEN
jgi:hypothetical protein